MSRVGLLHHWSLPFHHFIICSTCSPWSALLKTNARAKKKTANAIFFMVKGKISLFNECWSNDFNWLPFPALALFLPPRRSWEMEHTTDYSVGQKKLHTSFLKKVNNGHIAISIKIQKTQIEQNCFWVTLYSFFSRSQIVETRSSLNAHLRIWRPFLHQNQTQKLYFNYSQLHLKLHSNSKNTKLFFGLSRLANGFRPEEEVANDPEGDE